MKFAMKRITVATVCSLLFFLAVLFFACRKSDTKPPGNNPGSGDTTVLANADSLSDRLLFLRKTKIQGTIPSAPSGNDGFKISIKDTLYLTDELLKPIKFLHRDSAKNVSGVFVQVTFSGSTAGYYYDVPELENMKGSDSVSVILIGINPANLKKPQLGEIRIVPYNKNKQPIKTIVRPIKVVENRVDLPTATNSCGLSLPAGAFWQWDFTCRLDDLEKFFNVPEKVHSPQGQLIEGSCCNGISSYPARSSCNNLPILPTKLHFATYYQINFEDFTFFNTGKFVRHTQEDGPVPLPGSSNFCSGGPGVIMPSVRTTTYEGNWTISPSILPPNYRWPEDSLQVKLQTTSTSPAGAFGYGNPGGIIHQLDCRIGALVLIEPSRDGSDVHLVKSYFAFNLADEVFHD